MATKKKTVKKRAPKKTVPKKTTKERVSKKAAPRKKVAKKIPNPHIGKRYFQIEIGGHGGELIVGKASEEFVKYWHPADRKYNLTDHIYAMHEKP